MAFGRFSRLLCAVTVAVVLQASKSLGYDNSRSDNVVAYWGQNSYGATHSDQSAWQQALSAYCQDDNINVIPLAFLHVFFSTGGLPEINFSSTCSSNSGVFGGTNLANCQFMASDIKACQSRGKIITLSLGGATAAGGFSSDSQAAAFADTIWNLFLGGSSSTRPFGDAVLDGVDLDLEGGNGAYFPSFVNRIRSHANGASKKYYITAAPQCPYPDAYVGSVLNAVGFDAVYVQNSTLSHLHSVRSCNDHPLRYTDLAFSQVYNNYCGLNNFNNPNAWNFGTWDNWAKTVSPNKNVKVYIGAPASSTAAGSGYVDASTLGNIARQTKSQYSSFGGIMLWDVSQAYGNNRFDAAIKSAIAGGSSSPPPSSTAQPTYTPPASTTRPPSGGSCSGVSQWVSNVAYVGGNQVVYNGHLWTASWWSQADVPGGLAGVWVDNGACSGRFATPTADVKTPSATTVIHHTHANNTNSTVQQTKGDDDKARTSQIIGA